jgi:ligand-binding sensor domain-containing protein/DNA-binding response OmpR family regulator/nitrogen-specific signal transduction histidine kinase
MKHIRHCLTALFAIALSLMVWADSGDLFTSGKLSSSLINCIVQDKYGYIWVGTEYGLSKFDGYRFTNYLHNEEDTTSITDNIISDLLVDKKGNLWIGCAKGLMRYNYETNNFSRLQFPDGRKPRIYSMVESHRGDILLGTAGYGLYSVKNNGIEKTANNRFTIRWERAYAKRDSDVFFTHIYEDKHQYLWQSSHLSTFTRFIEKQGKVQRKDFKSPYGAPVEFIQHRPQAMLIVCMYGIIYYDYRTGRIADAGYDLGTFKNHVTINNATFDHDGNLYISTSEHGALIIKKGSNKVEQLENSNSNFNLSTAFVNDIIEDKDNNLWIGCYKKGLYLLNQRQQAFSSWSFSAQNYIIGSSVSSIAPGENGETWCTVQNSGVFCFDASGKIIAHPTSPAGTCIIYKDRRGAYWISNGSALYSYNPHTGAYQEKLTFTSAGIYCITDDNQGNLYISVYSKGLYIYNVESGKVTVLNMRQRGNKGFLCNDWVRSMAFDHTGHLWIGTSNGVSCLNTKTLSFKDFGWNIILKDRQANGICEGKNGNMIIGTEEGLYLFDRKNNKTLALPHAEVLKGKQVCSIIKDHQGDLWISTTMGIWQYDQKNRQFIGHINGNGLTTREYVLGSSMHTASDLIAFGTSDGITTFYPERVRAKKMELGDVHLTNFIIDGKPINCLTDEFTIPYEENSFTLEFSLLNYRNTDNISFQYRINEGKWNSTNEGSNAVSFNKLKPGSYTLEVRAMSNGNFSKKSTIIHIKVCDPWYASTWAFLLYFLTAAGIILYIIYRYERHRKEDLEETKMQFLINATHDIRSPLTLIMGPLNKLKTRITDAESKQDIDTIDRNAQRLLLLVNQILDERKIDKDQMHLHCQKTDLKEFLRGIMSLYNFNAQERSITLSLKEDESLKEEGNLQVWIDRINFDKVISNLLSNAMKYTSDGGEITLIIGKNKESAIIKVEDTGIGLKEEKTDRLFERFYQGNNNSDIHIEGTGIGLNLCRALVKMHGGAIRAYNRTDGIKGSCFEVNIPLGKEHLKPEEILQEDGTKTAESTGKRTQANRNFNILIVDDDAEIAHYIKTELSDWYRFDHARNGKEGLKMLLTGKYDLVISDVMMQEMDGVTMLKKIKGNSNVSDIPVILLTSKSEVENRLEGLRKGADAFLAKPFNMEELHILIDNLVDNVRRIRGKYSGAQGQKAKIEQIQVKGNNDALMERVMKYMNEHLADPDLNVEKLTEDVGISRAQLHRKLKEIAGVSAGEFIRNLRLEQAARLIEEGQINITQVAYSVGFSNQTHFSTVFKKHYGMSPSEYAETKRNEK